MSPDSAAEPPANGSGKVQVDASPNACPLVTTRCWSGRAPPDELPLSDVLPTAPAKLTAGWLPGVIALTAMWKSLTLMPDEVLARAIGANAPAAAATQA